MNFKKLIDISLISLSFFSIINFHEFAEARTISSARFFKGEYKDSIIYGALNDWDLRGCTVKNNKVVNGTVDKNLKSIVFQGKSIKITELMSFNPHGSSQIPSNIRDNPKFDECVNRIVFSHCYVNAGSKYYKWDDVSFRGIIKKRRLIYSIGINNNSYERGETVKSWASMQFNDDRSNNNTEYIINEDNLICNNR
jgi:hypothetical protein